MKQPLDSKKVLNGQNLQVRFGGQRQRDKILFLVVVEQRPLTLLLQSTLLIEVFSHEYLSLKMIVGCPFFSNYFYLTPTCLSLFL